MTRARTTVRATIVAALLFALPTGAAAQRRTPTSLAESPDRWLDRGEVLIRYRVLGEGPPLLLIHGYTDRVEMWTGTADSLARTHRVIVPDVRGFGESVPHRAAQYGKAMVEDLAALLDALAIREAHVAGYSMGGLLAAHLALDHPERVTSVTMIAPAVLEEDSTTTVRTLAPYIAAISTDSGLVPFFRWILPTWPDSVIEPAAAQILAASDRGALIAVANSIAELTPDWALVRRACIPMIVVVGTADPLQPHSVRVATRWPGARLVYAPAADHIDITSAPMTLAAIRDVVARAPRRGPGGSSRARCGSPR